ncbi:MAG: hypothetical protein ACFFCY_04695 [Promethearchaeota archaeon]
MKENCSGKYLSQSKYIQQHRAIDDAIYEAELLYFLYHEFKYPLDYQCKIHNIMNKSHLIFEKRKNLAISNQNNNTYSCSRKNIHNNNPEREDLL